MRISDWSSDVCSSDLNCLAAENVLPPKWKFDVTPAQIGQSDGEDRQPQIQPIAGLSGTSMTGEGEQGLMPQVGAVADQPYADQYPVPQQAAHGRLRCSEDDDERRPKRGHECVEGRVGRRRVEGDNRKIGRASGREKRGQTSGKT